MLKIVFKFNQTVISVGNVSAVDGTGATVSVTPSFANNEVIVNLASVPNGKRVTVSVSGVNGTAAATASIGFLLGDVNGSHTVDINDTRAVRARAGQAVDNVNFRYDINLTGRITASDIMAAKARSGSSLP